MRDMLWVARHTSLSAYAKQLDLGWDSREGLLDVIRTYRMWRTSWMRRREGTVCRRH